MSNLKDLLQRKATLQVALNTAFDNERNAHNAYIYVCKLPFTMANCMKINQAEDAWLETKMVLAKAKDAFEEAKDALEAAKNIKPEGEAIDLVPAQERGKEAFSQITQEALTLKARLKNKLKQWRPMVRLKKAVKTVAKPFACKSVRKATPKTNRAYTLLTGEVNMGKVLQMFNLVKTTVVAVVAAKLHNFNNNVSITAVKEADVLASAKLTAHAETVREERRKKQKEQIQTHLQKMDDSISVHKEIEQSIQDYSFVYSTSSDEYDFTSPFDKKLVEYRLEQNPICHIDDGNDNTSKGGYMANDHTRMINEFNKSHLTDKLVISKTSPMGDDMTVTSVEVAVDQTQITGVDVFDAQMSNSAIVPALKANYVANYERANDGKTLEIAQVKLSDVDRNVSSALTRCSIPSTDKLNEDQIHALNKVITNLSINEKSILLKGAQSESLVQIFNAQGNRTLAANVIDTLCGDLTVMQMYLLSALNAAISAPMGDISHTNVKDAFLPMNVPKAMNKRNMKPTRYVVYDSRIPVGYAGQYNLYLADAGSDGTYNRTGNKDTRQGQVRGYFLNSVSRKDKLFNPHDWEKGGGFLKGVMKTDLIASSIQNDDGSFNIVKKDMVEAWEARDLNWDIAVLDINFVKGRFKDESPLYKEAKSNYQKWLEGNESVMGKCYEITADVYEWFIRNVEGGKNRTLATSFQETIFWQGALVKDIYTKVDKDSMQQLMYSSLYRSSEVTRNIADDLINGVKGLPFIHGDFDNIHKIPYRTLSESTNSLTARIASSGTQRTKRILKEAWNLLTPLMLELVEEREIQYSRKDQETLTKKWWFQKTYIDLISKSAKKKLYEADNFIKELKENCNYPILISNAIKQNGTSAMIGLFRIDLDQIGILDDFNSHVGWDDNINDYADESLINKANWRKICDNGKFTTFWQDVFIPALERLWEASESKYVLNPLFRSVAKARVPITTDSAIMLMNAMPFEAFLALGEAMLVDAETFNYDGVPYYTNSTIELIMNAHNKKLEEREYDEVVLDFDTCEKRLIELYLSIKDSNPAGFFICNPCEGRDRNSDCDGDDTTCDPSLSWVELYGPIEQTRNLKENRNTVLEVAKAGAVTWLSRLVPIHQKDGQVIDERHPKSMNLQMMFPDQSHMTQERVYDINKTLIATLQGATGLASNMAADLYMRIDWQYVKDTYGEIVSIRPTVETTKTWKLWLFYAALIEIFISNQKRNVAMPFIGNDGVYKLVDAFIEAGGKGLTSLENIEGVHIATMEDELYDVKFLADNYTMNPKLVYKFAMNELELKEVCYWKASSKDGSLRHTPEQVMSLLKDQGLLGKNNRNINTIVAACEPKGWRNEYRGEFKFYMNFAHKAKTSLDTIPQNAKKLVDIIVNRVPLAFKEIAASRLAKGEDQDISKMSAIRRGNIFLEALGFDWEQREKLQMNVPGGNKNSGTSYSPAFLFYSLACAYDKARPINAMEVFASWLIAQNELSVDQKEVLKVVAEFRTRLLKEIACLNDKGQYVFDSQGNVNIKSPIAGLNLPVSQWTDVWGRIEHRVQNELDKFIPFILERCNEIISDPQEAYTFTKYALSSVNNIRKVCSYHANMTRVKVQGRGYVSGQIHPLVRKDWNNYCSSLPSGRTVKKLVRDDSWWLPLIGNTDPVSKAFANIRSSIPFSATANLKFGLKVINNLLESNPEMVIKSRSVFGGAGWANASLAENVMDIAKRSKESKKAGSKSNIFRAKAVLNGTCTDLLKGKLQSVHDDEGYEVGYKENKASFHENLLGGSLHSLNIKPFVGLIKEIVGEVCPLPINLTFTTNKGRDEFEQVNSKDAAAQHFVKLLVAYYVCSKHNLLDVDPTKTKAELQELTESAAYDYLDMLYTHVNGNDYYGAFDGYDYPDWATCEGKDQYDNDRIAPLVWSLSSHSTFKKDKKSGEYVQTGLSVMYQGIRVNRVKSMIETYRNLGH
jgi:hypothetical protein